MRSMRFRAWTVAAAFLLAGTAWPASQMFPTRKGEPFGVSAYLVAPSEGSGGAVPQGWQKGTATHFGNSALANEYFTGTKSAAVLATTSYDLPKSDYRVSILVRGTGRVRFKDAVEGKAFDAKPSNYYQWVEVGNVKNATRVSVELVPEGNLFYGGLLAEGTVLPVIPVAPVLEKLKKGGPATVLVLGDSVTENWGGTGGGASKFENGAAGRMLTFLKQYGDTDYITHRSPPTWPANRKKEADRIPRTTVDGKEYFDGRIEPDTTKKLRLVNMGTGGAAANYGWSRLKETLADNDYIDTGHETLRYGLARYKPDLVIINFGTNDVNGAYGPKGWGVEDYLFHMKTLATNIQQRYGAAVVLSTPHKWTAGTHNLPHLQPQMVDALRAWCEATGIRLADVYNEYGPGEYDGIHPRDLGHRHMADAYIKAILGQPSVPRITAHLVAKDLKDNGDGTVTDLKTGLVWTKSADLAGGVKTKAEADAFVTQMNAEKKFGCADWRLPTREELLWLVDPAQRPAVAKGSPFEDIRGWCLTATPGWGVDMVTGTPYAPSSRAGTRAGYIWAVRLAARPDSMGRP